MLCHIICLTLKNACFDKDTGPSGLISSYNICFNIVTNHVNVRYLNLIVGRQQMFACVVFSVLELACFWLAEELNLKLCLVKLLV
jgi:hypothetical protein